MLFPFARERIDSLLATMGGDPRVAQALARLSREQASESEPVPSAPGAYLLWLMDRDRKSTALKAIQGIIWEDGYVSGALKSAVFPDVKPAFERWTAAGRRIYIFSSGSVLAQRLLFGYSAAGDLTPFISGYFDTETGPKREAPSYKAIGAAIGLPPKEILFVSDVAEELHAAKAVGMGAVLSVRPGNKPVQGYEGPAVGDFAEIP